MNAYRKTTRLLTHALPWIGLAAGISLPAVGADATPTASQADELGEVIVTGSRIRGVAPVGSPVIALDREAIVESGALTTSDLVRKLPLVVGLGASETASGAQNGAANVSRGVSINLRGIGSNATLVLLGGHRLPPAGTQGQFTDVSVIPSIAIERLEVVADGGSAIYGSDAITGVVNMIPRRNFTGAETALRYGFADGYTDWSIAQLLGTAWERGRATIAIERNEHSALRGIDRDFYTSDLRASGGSDLRSQLCSPGNIVVGGVPYAIPANSTGTGLTPGMFTAGTRNLCDNFKRGDIIGDLERTSVLANVEQSLTDSLTLFAEGVYSRREFTLQSDSVTSNLTVTNANPFYFNPTGGTGPVTVQYDFDNDGGLPANPGHAQSWLALVGARQALGGDWSAEATASYGKSEDVVSRTQNLNTTTAGINAFLANPNPAVAFNPFGGGGISNATTVAAIRNGQFIIAGDTRLTTLAAQADGSVMSLPAGNLRLAVGAEYRREGLAGSLQSGSTTAPVFVPSSISRNMHAAFAEVYLPLFSEANAVTGVRRLDLSVAGRYEDYSDFGSTFNPKIGLTWEPLQGLGVRGSWGKSFRAPGLAETDPRSSGYGLYGDTLQCNHRAPATTCFGIGIAGGNPELDPETATTWSVGVDLSPAALPGFRASLTYWDIQYRNQILGLRGTAGLLTNGIYSPYRVLNPTAAEVSALLASGLPVNSPINATLVTYIQDGRRQNLGGTFASGIDLELSQAWDLGASTLRLGATGTRIDSLKTASAPGAALVEVQNTLNFPQQFRARLFAGLSRGDFDAMATLSHVGSYRQTGVTPVRNIDSFDTLDLHFGYEVSAVEGLSASLDVQNALDEEPPFVNQAGGYDPQSASPLLRLISLGLRMRW